MTVALSNTLILDFWHPEYKGKISLLCKTLQFSSVELLNLVWLFATQWTAACQASPSQNLLKLMSIESVMPSNHLILCRPLLLQPSMFSSIRVFSNESALCIRWPKYWSFSFNISPSNESFQSVQSLSRVWLFATPWTTARQASLSFTNSQNLPKLMSIESVISSNHLILCPPLLLLPSNFLNSRVWSPLGWTGWISLQSKGLARVFYNATVQKHQFFCAQLSL